MENYKLSRAFKLKVLVALTIAVTLSLGFYMYEGRTITLHLDQDVDVITSRASTVEEFLKEQNITLRDKGYINMSLDKELEENLTIIIKTTKDYTISSAGAELDVISTYTKVEEILDDLGFQLDEEDYTYPDRKVKVAPGGTIEIYDVEEVVEILEEAIPFGSIVKKNSSVELGSSKTIQEGKEGLKQIETLKRYVNGQLTNESVVKEEIVEKPIEKIVEKGSKERIIATSRGNTDYRKAVVMSATAYDLSFASCGKNPGDKGYGITASGTKARPGAVAVDPKVIPLGTKLYIESLDSTEDYGFAVAEDTGGAIKGNKIDLFFHSGKDVKNFGRRKVKVYILK